MRTAAAGAEDARAVSPCSAHRRRPVLVLSAGSVLAQAGRPVTRCPAFLPHTFLELPRQPALRPAARTAEAGEGLPGAATGPGSPAPEASGIYSKAVQGEAESGRIDEPRTRPQTPLRLLRCRAAPPPPTLPPRPAGSGSEGRAGVTSVPALSPPVTPSLPWGGGARSQGHPGPSRRPGLPRPEEGPLTRSERSGADRAGPWAAGAGAGQPISLPLLPFPSLRSCPLGTRWGSGCQRGQPGSRGNAGRGGAGGRAAAMGSWAAATWRLGGCSGRVAPRGAPRRRGSSRPVGGDQAATLSDLLQSSVEAEERDVAATRRERRSPREGTVLLFPGQGSQFVGMGRGLLRYPAVRDMYRLAEKVLGYDLLSLCLEGPRDELDRTQHCQPAVFVASLAAVEKLNHQQPKVRGAPRWEAGVGAAGPRLGPCPRRAAARRLPRGVGHPRGKRWAYPAGAGWSWCGLGPVSCRWWRAAWRRRGTA